MKQWRCVLQVVVVAMMMINCVVRVDGLSVVDVRGKNSNDVGVMIGIRRVGTEPTPTRTRTCQNSFDWKTMRSQRRD